MYFFCRIRQMAWPMIRDACRTRNCILPLRVCSPEMNVFMSLAESGEDSPTTPATGTIDFGSQHERIAELRTAIGTYGQPNDPGRLSLGHWESIQAVVVLVADFYLRKALMYAMLGSSRLYNTSYCDSSLTIPSGLEQNLKYFLLPTSYLNAMDLPLGFTSSVGVVRNWDSSNTGLVNIGKTSEGCSGTNLSSNFSPS